MGITITDYIMYLLSTVFISIWIVFYFKGKKYASMFESLDEKDYPLKDVYFVGYAILEAVHYQYKSKSDRTLRRDIKILYGEKYSEYYVRVIYAQKVTISTLLFALAFSFYGLADSFAAVVVMLMFTALAYYYFGTLTSKKILSRSDEMLSDFSNVVSKLALLTNAGMIMREAWAAVAYNGDTLIYREMQKAVDEMKNGIAETECYHRFGNRCVEPSIKKFTSTIIQSIEKGNNDISAILMRESSDSWNVRKQSVKRQGERANSKLLFPMFMMFIGIMIMVVIPIFSNIGI